MEITLCKLESTIAQNLSFPVFHLNLKETSDENGGQ
jgi:hypothetical protein